MAVRPSLRAGIAKRGVIYLLISAASFGSLVVLIKGAVAAGLNAETALALRFTLAALIWWAILLLRRQRFRVDVRQAARAGGLGAFFYATNALCYYWGTARVSGTIAALAVAAVPVVVAVLAWFLLRERLGRTGWLALALAVVGGIMLAGGPGGRTDVVGLLLLGGAIVLYSLYIVLSTPLSRTLAPSVTTAYVITGAAAFYWLWGGLTGRINLQFAPDGWAIIVAMALIPTVLAIYALLVGTGAVGPSRASIVGSLEPLVGVMLSVLFLGERPGLLQIGGGGLVILAALLVRRERAIAGPKKVTE